MRVYRFILFVVFVFVLNSVAAHAASPLSFTEIETLLKSKVSNDRIVILIKERKVSFVLTKVTVKKLKSLGANQAVINAIEKNIQAGMQIESEPSGADVFVDRKFRGNTPLHLSSIATGKHELRLDNIKGYKDYVIDIELLTGQAWKNTVVLKKLDDPASPPPELSSPPSNPTRTPIGLQQMVAVRVRTEPVNANIYLDDKYIGESPAEFLALIGNHHLRLVPKLSAKYETVEKEFTVRSKELNVVFLRLNSKRD
jgi:hypothetical protein